MDHVMNQKSSPSLMTISSNRNTSHNVVVRRRVQVSIIRYQCFLEAHTERSIFIKETLEGFKLAAVRLQIPLQDTVKFRHCNIYTV